MEKWFLVLGFAAAFALGKAQGVAYETRGETLAAALRTIGERAGKPIEVDRALANEIVIVRAKSRPVEDLLRQLAAAVGGQLTPSNGGWRIAPDLEAQANQERADLARRSQAIAAALATRRKTLDDQPDFAEREARLLVARMREFEQKRQRDPITGGSSYLNLWSSSPDGRLLTRVLERIGTEALATIEPGQRRVFAERPNRLQRPLPAMSVIAERYMAEAKPLADLVSGEQISGFAILSVPEVRPVRWLLEAKRGPFESGLELVLRGLDAEGAVRTRVSTDLTVSRLFSGGPPTPAPDEKPFAFSPTTKRILAEIAKNFLSGQGDVYLPEDLRKPLFDPIANDPLSWWVADGLLALANRENRDLVACVPDLVLLPTLMMAAMEFESPKAGALETYLSADAATLARPEGWLVVSPRSFRWSRELRLDRRVLKTYLDAVSRGGADFLETARYVYGAPRAFSDSLAPYYLLLVSPESMEALSSVNDHSLLRIVGSLSPAQQAAIGPGLVLTIGQLSPETRKEVEAYTFGPYAQELTRLPEPGAPHNLPTAEPTERFLNGLPPTLSLAVAPIGESLVLRAVEQGGAPAPREWEAPETLRRRTGASGAADWGRFRFLLGERSEANVALHYEPGWAVSGHFRCVRKISAEYRDFAALPEGVRRALLGGAPQP